MNSSILNDNVIDRLIMSLLKTELFNELKLINIGIELTLKGNGYISKCVFELKEKLSKEY